MKRLKLTFSLLITALCFSMVFISCSEDNESLKQNEVKGLTVLNKQYFPINDEFNYKDDSSVRMSKYIDGEFAYNMTIADNFVFTNDSGNMRVLNEITGEYIDIINVVEHIGYRTFDATNNLGQTLNGFTMEITEDEEYSRKNPWVYVIFGVLDLAVELLTDSPMVECTNAMQSISCQSGTNPYMDFEDAGWFTGASCSVGCR